MIFGVVRITTAGDSDNQGRINETVFVLYHNEPV